MSTATWAEPTPAGLLDVVAEGPGWRAINKPAGLLVHPSALDAQETDTVVARAAAQWGDAGDAGGAWHPVHRLDKGTSGLLLLAQDPALLSAWGAAFRDGQVKKRYLGLVRGWPGAEAGTVDHPLARDPELPSQGQPQWPAQTHWTVLNRHEWPVATQPGFATTRTALLRLEPEQGRRHQIRRHCKHMAHPLIGDATHGKGPLNRALAAHFGLQRLWLHAEILTLPEGRVLHAPPGPEWAALRG
ncbi:RluA family pseudouridine synthase [Inhella gelatinilytica]|uniref:tRNA pseudouridine synthase C n=1 Tax=Inhella gelatinilytica TaxID=2795030 RepID=A0A931IWJ9_9BURK|nr:pseudouridine synthase [Inhella gelatinilytica]MBH9554170.1 pseudouridine synthase [Inhella gelatinilytica]